MYKILAIIGSASSNSLNLALVKKIENLSKGLFELEILDNLKSLPGFDPELSINNTPPVILAVRESIARANGIIICTPEYIFSIPSRLKNIIEWCISTTVFSNKPCGLVIVSTSGIMAHEDLKALMKTAMAKITDESTLLIPKIGKKFDVNGNLEDIETVERLYEFIKGFQRLLNQ